jgi:hypothetical protein
VIPRFWSASKREERDENQNIRIVRPLGVPHSGDDLVVFFRRQYANEGHHPLHESAPSWIQTVVFGSFNS